MGTAYRAKFKANKHSSVLFDKVLMQGDQFELFNYFNTA